MSRHGCSQYVTANLDASAVALAAARQTGPLLLYNTSFTPDALPTSGTGGAAGDDAAAPREFLTYLSNAMLAPARAQGSCGSCYSFSISGAIGYGLFLAYERLGGYFSARYISQQFLVTCYQVEGAICGCNGGDLAKALAYVQEHGVPTFRQFPYVNGPDVVTPDATNHYICEASLQRGNSLGTCAPCRPGEPSYETVLSRAELTGGLVTDESALVQVKASCLPCRSVGGPRYFPTPIRVFDPAKSLEEATALAKRLLATHGPLCTALRINQEEFLKLGVRGPLLPLRSTPVYAPRYAPAASAPLHAVLIVGYSDPGDRDAAVWICRNSWGDAWASYLPGAAMWALDSTGAVVRRSHSPGGFFLVSMYRAADVTGIMEHAVSVGDLRVRMPDETAPRSLRVNDVFVVPFPVPNVLPAARPRRPRRHSHMALWLVAVLLGILAFAQLLW